MTSQSTTSTVAELLEAAYAALAAPTNPALAAGLLLRALGDPSITPDAMVTAYVGLAQAALFTSAFDAGLRAANALIEIGGRFDLAGATATGLTISAQMQIALGAPVEARSALLTALQSFRRALLPEQAAAAWWMLAEIDTSEEDLVAARAALTRSARVCRKHRLRGDLARVDAMRARIAMLVGRPREALRRAVDAARSATLARDAYRAAQAYRVAATACHRLGKLRHASTFAERAILTFRGVGDRQNLGRTLFEHAQILLAGGRLPAAMLALSEAVAVLRASNATEELAQALMLAAQLDQLHGRPDRALETLTEAEGLLRSIDRADARAGALRARGAVLLQLGRATEAVAVFDTALGLLGDTPYREVRGHVLHGRGAALLGCGRLEEAAAVLLEAATVHAGVSPNSEVAASHRLRAMASLRLERLPEALAAADEALACATGDRLAESDARATRAIVRLRLGDTRAARRDAQHAARAFQRLGQWWNLAVLEGSLATSALARGEARTAKRHAVASLRWLDRFSRRSTRVVGHADLIERFQQVQDVILALLRREHRVQALIERVEATRAATLRLLLPSTNDPGLRGAAGRASIFAPRTRCTNARVDELLEGALARASSGTVTLAWYPEDAEGKGELLLVTPKHGAWFFREAVSHARIYALVGQLNAQAVHLDEVAWASLLRALAADLLERPLREGVPIRSRASAPPRTVADALRAHPTSPIDVVPHGVLHLVPWSALPLGDEARPLVQGHVVRLLPHLPASARPLPPAPRRALVFGLGGGGLEGASREASAIASTLRKAGIDVVEFGRERPLTIEVLRAEGRTFDFLHIATHAVFDAAAPWRSWIQLSSGIDGGSGDRLSLEELLNLGIAPNRVVLSACSSALADRGRLFDPVSLAHGFLGLGAHAVIGTLWQVNDEHMVDFLRDVYGQAIAADWRWDEAVREATLNAMNQGAPSEGRSGKVLRSGLLAKARSRVVSRGPSVACWAAVQVIASPQS